MYDRKSTKKNLPSLLKQMVKKFRNIFKLVIKSAMRSILKALIALNRRGQWSRAGFVLPTVTMVMLVVVLLSIAISLRSFDRAQDARNVRVSQAVLSAAAPALDRARAKLEELLVVSPPTTDTPTDDALYAELTTTVGIPDGEGNVTTDDKYTFGDEQRLKISYKIQGNSIEEDGEDDNPDTIEDNEITKSAWRFPVDTDNNGKFDSFTVYGIFFRTPERDDDGNFKWARTPLDARTPPMESGEINQNADCEVRAGSTASLVGDSGWYKLDAKLKKSFFVYTVTVPITDTDLSSVTEGYDTDDFERFTGTTGFSALEYQQDWQRIPLTNNAVVYEDDLEIYPGPEFRLNGRIQANSNAIVSSTGNNDIEFYLVSSKNSCFFQDEENSKIIVGGNVINGLVEENDFDETIEVHLQQGNEVDLNAGEISQTHESVSAYSTSDSDITNEAKASAYNSEAYANRISWMVNEHITANPTPALTGDPETDGIVAADPGEVRTKIKESTNKDLTRRNALETYFKKLVRKVPFAEVSEDGTDGTVTLVGGTPTDTLTDGTGDSLRPAIADWVLPTNGDINVGESTGPTNLTLELEELEATHPEIVEENDGYQYFVGDRVLVGNNLPQKVWQTSGFTNSYQQLVDGTEPWLKADGSDATAADVEGSHLRYREPRVATIADVGSTDRDGFWEDAAATEPEAALDGIGGLRVITGAGVYERTNSFLPPPPDNWLNYTEVWPDTMPMSPVRYSKVYNNQTEAWDDLSGLTDAEWNAIFDPASPDESGIDPKTRQYAKGDLRMRAAAVYHYAEDFINDLDDFEQKPIACISSYYDPSTSITARNESSLTDVSGLDEPDYTSAPGSNAGNSNNGIVYGPPPDVTIAVTKTGSDMRSWQFTGTDAVSVYLAEQANLVFSYGRFVNEKLRDALATLADGDTLSLSQQSAIDTTLCALGILGNSEVTLGSAPSYIPDGAIKEIAFLDARQIKASDPDNDTTADIDESFTIFDFDDSNGIEEPDITSDYNLSLEERQPMEIRATQLDLDRLRQAGLTPTESVGPRRDGNEYMLPFSGIIYASRDDAMPDRSDPDSTSDEDLANSPYDYKLDPTRRPNAIMLINGEKVARPQPTTMTSEEVTKEKGLTLVSNLPVYIQGDFNLHENSSGTVEEFNETLLDNWGNFYDRSNINVEFACRAGDPRLACEEGDNWRPVNILSDTLTLLSDEWRPGFRNEGDFDLRNNAGNGAVMATQTEATKLTAQDLRRHNGFYANNYATNGLSSGASFQGATFNDADYSRNSSTPGKSSYFNNFVTPVQRRVEFNEYVMEVCLKLPVSACEASDWVVGEVSGGNITDTTRTVYELFESNASFLEGAIAPDTTANIDSGIAASSLASGTTALPPHPDWQRFPRRVAFLRNEYGELEMTGEFTPVPIGVDGSGNVKAYFYSNGGTDVPRLADNALWFKTTNSTTAANTSQSYDADQLLYYLGYDSSQPDTSGNKPVLPPLPTIEIDGTEYSLKNDVVDVSEYAVCMAADNGRNSDSYFVMQNPGPPPGTARNNAHDTGSNRRCMPERDHSLISDFWDGVFTATSSGEDEDITSDITTDRTISDSNNDNLVVVHLPATIGSASTPAMKLTLEGDANTIFVLRRDGDLTFNNVTMELDGVDPNNVFWVMGNNVTFNDENQHIAGNFIGNVPASGDEPIFSIGEETYLRGVRILGFRSLREFGGTGINDPASAPNNVDIRAMTNQANISLVPVLQINEPDATAAGTVNGGPTARNNTNWMFNPTDSHTYNLVAAIGDTPSRPGAGNGGLQNLVGVLENWKYPTARTMNISGAFIQLGRSKYATAPRRAVRTGTDMDPNPELFGYDHSYPVGEHDGTLGYQTPPERPWGFDVGLLSQSPDLFAQKFSLPSSDNKPNEYFREVSRDDDWVKGLLCAKTDDDDGSTSVNAVSRPSRLDCIADGYED